MFIHFNLIEWFATIISWSIIGFIAFKIYQKKTDDLENWKLVFIILIGFLALDLNWVSRSHSISFAVIPLGVLILALFLKKRGSWEKYKPYAWLGFWANYIFLFLSLIANLIHGQIYDKSDIHTFISDTSNMEVINVDTSKIEYSVSLSKLMEMVESAYLEESDDYYWIEEDLHTEQGTPKQFPYQLIEVNPKWGSGIDASIFLEKDRQGILILTEEENYYFRTAEPF
ncbi:hypothetical protein [Gracilibacillus dipsosauri]|uniref:Uncharacterized protein n=1 Tax=Gracilibacillus dipsosauri TaxID=178340 RepID=A0A317KZU6_9BACI|nr:hypothetical protein [Gracilibacillus dipsosauri]PWU69071.1 hypothetical protein DLJ74_11720 [Gracilibacillus dipsosauri]